MTSVDTLYSFVAGVVAPYVADEDDPNVVADVAIEAVIEFAAQDPARLRVVLEVIGLEVREGFLMFPEDNRAYFDRPAIVEDGDTPVLVCRVRPREEKTDG